jgi:hypothetical protein
MTRMAYPAVPRRLLSVKTARPKLLSANATVTKCKMDWNTVSTARTFWNFPLYYILKRSRSSMYIPVNECISLLLYFTGVTEYVTFFYLQTIDILNK